MTTCRVARMAGSWYPDQPTALASLLDELRPAARPTSSRPAPSARLAGLLAPHAGYQYSGHTAAVAYAALDEWRPVRVVVLAPSHREAFSGACAWSPVAGRAAPGSWRTPLGEIPVDDAFLERLGHALPRLRYGQAGHGEEHSLELQLPFLQQVLGAFRLAPIVLGEQSADTVLHLSAALSEVLRDEQATCPTLLVASSDLSHFHPLDIATRLDSRFLDLFAAGDEHKLLGELAAGSCEACGGGPAAALLSCCRHLMKRPIVEVLDYRTSAEAGGDEGSVVGYGAALVRDGDDV